MDAGNVSSSLESDSPKRKRLDSLTPEDNRDNYEEIVVRKVSEPRNGSTDDDDDEPEAQQHYKTASDAVELKIRSIREKMNYFNQHVSGLLEEGKSFFLDAATQFEKQVVAFHEKQIDKWEREIDLLRSFDEVNRDLTHRLADSQAAISQLMDHLMTPAMEL